MPMRMQYLPPLYLLFFIINYLVLSLEYESYAVVIDAGSTGSRLFVLKFIFKDGIRNIIPSEGLKISPGLSSFASNPQGVVDYITPVIIKSIPKVPVEHLNKTKLYIKATAGMRLILLAEEDLIWSHLIAGLRSNSNIPYIIDDENFGTIDGYSEGYYAVLASNFVAGRIDGSLRRIEGKDMLGALDMGGSSTQLIYMNKDVEYGHPVTKNDFWLHSWLNYGVEAMRERLLNHFISKSDLQILEFEAELIGDVSKYEKTIIENPCAFIGYKETYKMHSFIGTGSSVECIQEVKKVIWNLSDCPEASSCPIDGISPPELKGHFYAMSVYFYAIDCIRHYGIYNFSSWPTPSIDEIENAASNFCSSEWDMIHSQEVHKYTKKEQLSNRCFESLYIATLLKYGFRIEGHKNIITLALKVEGVEVEWTLGYALSELNLYPTMV